MPTERPPKASTPQCPICRKPTEPQFRPFCSKRCADVDLGRWLSGSYAIPVVEEDRSAGSDERDGRD